MTKQEKYVCSGHLERGWPKEAVVGCEVFGRTAEKRCAFEIRTEKIHVLLDWYAEMSNSVKDCRRRFTILAEQSNHRPPAPTSAAGYVAKPPAVKRPRG